MSFDSHCHITSDAFDEDRQEVLRRAWSAGVQGVVAISSTPDDARNALRLAEADPRVWCTAGLHPHEAGEARKGWDLEVGELLTHPRVVAVGECGLDFHYDFAPRASQVEVLERQVALAERYDLPLVIHSRSADSEMCSVLRGLPPGIRGVLHCFTGGDELLDAGLEAGWYVSFSGIVTFSRFDGMDQVRRVPEERILVETDAPYLAPVPHRGHRNEPAFVTLTSRRVAEIRGEDPGEFSRRVTENARAFYGLEPTGGAA
ncbi:MAG: TatD family hydrolase [Gemmatimonadales bacterium]|jgi:TatD DNase family protein|nr:MAG: TatD family hydrolase [Gemmatimonadales bacterium]